MKYTLKFQIHCAKHAHRVLKSVFVEKFGDSVEIENTLNYVHHPSERENNMNLKLFAVSQNSTTDSLTILNTHSETFIAKFCIHFMN